MERTFSLRSLVTVISLLLTVIWLSPALALGAPTFASLGEIRADGLRIPGAMDLDGSGNLYVADARGGRLGGPVASCARAEVAITTASEAVAAMPFLATSLGER